MHTRILFAVAACTALAGCSKAEPVNITENGVLEDGDSVLEDDNSLYDEYTFSAAAGMELVVEMTSDEFDTFLLITGPGGFQEQNDDFDAMEGTDSKIEVTLEAGGQYTVLANAYAAPECEGEGEAQVCTNMGAYTLSIVTTARE